MFLFGKKNTVDLLLGYFVKVPNDRRSQMADSHLGLGSNVQLGLVDFKVCDWPPETSLNGQSQTLKSCWPLKTSLNWLIRNFKILLVNYNQSQLADYKTLKSTRPSWTFEP